GLPNLKELSLYRLRVTDRGCKTLATMTSLQRLSLDGSMISDAGLKALGELPTLERLSVWQCRGVSDEAFAKFEKDHPKIKLNR
ncbi:MAG: ribonuclease inhibitor, partial [Planctomycetota bacterium]